MDATQPLYYHVSDPLQNISLRVTLRRVYASETKEGKSRGGDNDGIVEIKRDLGWQEKVFGPREIALLSPDEQERKEAKKSPRLPKTPRSGIRRATSMADSDYREILFQKFRDGIDPLDTLEEAMIYTYVDKDNFVAKSRVLPRLTTSSKDEDPRNNPLGVAYATLPLRNIPKDVLPMSSNAMKTHMSREAPFKIMYVMAAVDCDVERIKKGSLEADEAEIFGGPETMGGTRFYEKCLCAIKVFRNNTMEAMPGFSEEEVRKR